MAVAILGVGMDGGVALAGSGPAYAVVVPTVENMYSAPDASKDVVSQAVIGQVVRVLEARDGFVRIETPDRYTGWVAGQAIREYPEGSSDRYASGGTVAEVTSLIANLYREPSVTTARPKSQAPLGARLEVAAEKPVPAWHEVRLPDGEAAFVQAGDVRLAAAGAPLPSATGAALVATARRFLGVPYLWGGMTPLGVDCSGLVSRAYGMHGITLPRDADLQFTDPSAAAVPRGALQPGDLLFFGAKKITHVGLYAGQGRFIHATTHVTPVVQEGRLKDPYWASIYRGARRPQ